MCISEIANMVFERIRDGTVIGTCLIACISMGQCFLVYLPRITTALEKIANE